MKIATRSKGSAKLSALTNRRLTGLFLPVVIVLGVATIGATVFHASHAATPTVVQILNYADAAQTSGVSNIASNVQSLGDQTVSQVNPGAELDYMVSGKAPVNNQCYYFQIMPLKGGGTTAKISFAGVGATKTVNIAFNPLNGGYLQKVCVPTGTGTTQAYSVKNLSPATGPLVLVYQDEVTQPAQVQ